MSEIRREQCDPLPNEAQRLECVRQVNDIEDNALSRLDPAVCRSFDCRAFAAMGIAEHCAPGHQTLSWEFAGQ